ncbi:hypothetical protein, partial [Enterobacter hormaechei]|uniref:hypothetical protein n=1 Tax=Enterobacter hormaechei TaxID=158836 RepID=UPI0022A9FA99
EWVHVQLHQQKGMISLSPPTICNSASKQSLKNLTPTKGHTFVSVRKPLASDGIGESFSQG